jgi:uncharacterized protein (TIGR00369 family)
LFDRMSTVQVDGSLGIEVLELLPDGARLRLPIPRGSALAEEVGGIVALTVLADAAGGCAMARAQGAGLSGPTIELRVDHALPHSDRARWMVAESRMHYLVGDAGYVTVEIREETGQPLARAQGHFVMLPPDAASWPEPDGVVLKRPDELLAALAPGAGTPAEWPVSAIRQLANPRGQVHGGVLMAIGQLAQRRLQRADLDEPAALLPLSVGVEYLRPASADGSELLCRTEYVRRGRRFRTLRTELVRPDGRIAAIATGLWSLTAEHPNEHIG